jgi:effector-binding domain-containing protein
MADEDKIKEKKKRVFNFLKSEGLLQDKRAGTLLIHYNDGGVTKIADHRDILK